MGCAWAHAAWARAVRMKFNRCRRRSLARTALRIFCECSPTPTMQIRSSRSALNLDVVVPFLSCLLCYSPYPQHVSNLFNMLRIVANVDSFHFEIHQKIELPPQRVVGAAVEQHFKTLEQHFKNTSYGAVLITFFTKVALVF